MKQYDAIVIGAGQAGPALAGQLINHGRRAAIADGYRFGGSYVNYVCRPTNSAWRFLGLPAASFILRL